jgi:hypothetical protein
MKNLKLFSIIALAAMFTVSCTSKNTIVKFTSPESVSVKIGEALNFAVSVKVTDASGNTEFAFQGLPEWVQKAEGDNKVTLTGTAPGQTGEFAVTVKATNNKVTATQNLVIKVTDGSTGNDEGTEANPYDVASAIANQGASKWVRGYIVGYAWAESQGTGWYFTADTCHQKTNIVVAATSSETNSTNLLPVQLPTGEVRNGINLQDNAGVLGKEVLLYGSLEAYFGQPGLKSTSYAKLIEAGTEFGTKPVDVTGAILNETLLTQASFDKFRAVNVSGTQVWKFKSPYGADITGYENSVNNANEDWLISPAMDFTGKTNLTLTFEHAINKGVVANMPTEQTLWFSDNYSGDLNTADWVQVTIATYPAGNSWAFSQTVNSVPASFEGETNVVFAFKYICGTSSSAEWEIKNVLVK